MINKEKFRESFNYHDRDATIRIIDSFIESYSDELAELQANIHNSDFNALDINAHTYKSTVAYMSTDLYEVAKDLEFLGKDKLSDGLQETFDKLKTGSIVLVNELKEIRKEYE